MPNRHHNTPDYRYGFNGKEMDDEIKGEGVQYDYGFRIYDPRLGKFLSQDPLFKDYPMLTPYQFASNTPIQAIDVDGKEGETYLETKIENGKEIILHRVVEVDLYVAISRDRKSSHFFSKKEKNDAKIRQKLLNDLASQYQDGKFKDSEGNEIVWRFNVHSFVVDDNSNPEDFVKNNLISSPNNFIEGIDGRTGIKSVVVQQESLSVLPSYNPDTEKIENADSLNELGYYDGKYTIGVNDVYIDKKGRQHTFGHEIGHFFLRKHPNLDIRNMNDSAERHNLAGEGIFKYSKLNYSVTKSAIKTGGPTDYTINTTFEGRQDLNQENVNEILKSVIDTGKKEIEK